MRRTWLALTLLLAATGCTSVQPLTLCGGMIQNRSGRLLTDIRVVHYPTQRVVMTNQLLPERSFRLGFEERAMRAEMASITWEDPQLGVMQQTVMLPKEDGGNGSRWLIYQIHPDGNVTANLGPCL